MVAVPVWFADAVARRASGCRCWSTRRWISPSPRRRRRPTGKSRSWSGWDRSSTAYCSDPASRADRLASPAAAGDGADLSGIAPALIVTAQKDIPREEAVRYAERLRATGGLREQVDVPNVGHGFNILGAPHAVVLPVYDTIAQHIRQTLT